MAEALLHLLRTSGPELHALFLRLTLRADRAEELMQELFLKLHRTGALARAENPRAYAYRAAIHLALDLRRREKSQPRVHGDVPENIAAPGTPPLQALIVNEQAQQVLAVMAELSGPAREAAVLHYIQQRSYEETAAMMEKTPHQVRALCQDALRQLRGAMQTLAAREVSHG